MDSPKYQPPAPPLEHNHHGNYEIVIINDVGLFGNCAEPVAFTRSPTKGSLVELFYSLIPTWSEFPGDCSWEPRGVRCTSQESFLGRLMQNAAPACPSICDRLSVSPLKIQMLKKHLQCDGFWRWDLWAMIKAS